MPSDVTGSSIYNQRDGDFEFRPGPIFTNLLLADEINRAPPKTQAALLEAMQERQVTIEGVTHLLERPFIVLATQNPIEYEGTYPLPEAQLDRFLLRIGDRLPEPERRVGDARAPARAPRGRGRARAGRRPRRRCSRCSARSRTCTCARASAATSSTSSPRRATSTRVQVGASPRGTLALLKLARVPRRARRPRLRHPRRREGGRRARARPPADAAARAVGAARRAARTSSPRCSRPCRRRAAEDLARRAADRRRGAPAPRLTRYAGARRALGLLGALVVRPARARGARRAVRGARSRSGSARARRPSSRVAVELDARAGGRGDELDARRWSSSPRAPVDGSSCCSRCPAASSVEGGASPRRCRLGRRRRARRSS